MRSLIALALAATALLGGCAGAAPEGGAPAGIPCDFGGAAPDVGPEICERAIALAEARLGWLHWPVASTRFRASMCPPNARCLAASGDEGWVIFEFTVGDPVMIRVGPPIVGNVVDLSRLVAGDPEPLPDWLREELDGTGDPSEP